MADKKALRKRITPSVPLSLTITNGDDSSFVVSFLLTFDFNAMALVEANTGLSMLTGEVFVNPNATKISILLWAAVQTNQPEYEGEEGLEAIRSFLTTDNVTEVLKAVDAAFLAALPKERAEELKAAAEAKRNGTAGKPADPTTPPTV